MSRNLRPVIPVLLQHFKPKTTDAKAFRANRERIQLQQKAYHNRLARNLPTLEKGECVRMSGGKMETSNRDEKCK